MRLLTNKLAEAMPGVYAHWCPGCNARHHIDVPFPGSTYAGPKWSYNGDADSPTFSPSINIVGRCHYFITAGSIQFCGDSIHALAGQTVPLPDFPAHVLAYHKTPEDK